MINAEEYLGLAQDDADTADRQAQEGDLLRASGSFLTATLYFLKYAVRCEDGFAALARTDALRCLRAAAANTRAAHPTYLLDAAHVAVLFDERELGASWLDACSGSPDRWSSFWRRYARDLASLIRCSPLDTTTVEMDSDAQSGWLPYFELMLGLSRGEDTNLASVAVRRAFVERQKGLADPGLLDGRPGDPIHWDWRYSTIVKAARGSS